jgi:outer membrane autotransporter protein
VGAAGDRGLWARGYGVFGDIDGDGNAAGADYTTGGLAVGLDTALGEHWTVGVSAGYGRTDVDSFGAELDVDSYQFAAYAGYRQGGWHADALVGHAWQDVDSMRPVSFGGVDSLSTAGYDLKSFSAVVEAGHDFAWSARTTLTPFVALEFTRSHRDGFTETGVAGLTVDGRTEHSLRPTFGVRLSREIETEAGGRLEPMVYAAYAREVMDNVSRVRAAFANAPAASFLIDGPDTDRDRFLAGAALATRLTERAVLALAWDAELADSDTAHAVSATFRYRW